MQSYRRKTWINLEKENNIKRTIQKKINKHFKAAKLWEAKSLLSDIQLIAEAVVKTNKKCYDEIKSFMDNH